MPYCLAVILVKGSCMTWGKDTALKYFFLISGKMEKFKTKRFLQRDPLQLRGARYSVQSGLALGSQSSLLGDSLGPVVWASQNILGMLGED